MTNNQALRNRAGGGETRKVLAMIAALALTFGGILSGLFYANTAQAAPTGNISNPYPEVDPATGAINIDAIASDLIDNANLFSSAQGSGKDVVSGRASIFTPKGGGQLQATYDSYEPIPDGSPVYLQWVDSDGAVSPLYVAHTHELPGAAGTGGSGLYAFKVPKWTDANGKEHQFKTLSSQRYRVFADPAMENPKTGNKLELLRNAPGYTPYAFGRGSGDGIGELPGAVGTNGNMQRTGVWYYERPGDYVRHANPIEDPLGPLSNPVSHYDETALKTFSGNVWYELGNERQMLSGATLTSDPAPSPGYTVWASTLTAEGRAAYEAQVNSQSEFNQAAEAKKLLEANPNYIAATVYGPIVDGKYTLRFPTDAYNQDYVYMWVEDPEGNVVNAYSTFTQPEFQNPRHNLQVAPTLNPGQNNAGLIGKPFERFYNINFALVSTNQPKIDITNFNTTTKPARVGDVAELKGSGTLPPLPSKIEWRNSKGDVLNTCDITTTADLKECKTFTVPDNAKNGEIFTAYLVAGSQDIDADSFVVIQDDDGDNIPDDKGDTDINNDGEPNEKNPTTVPDEQNLTHGVKLVDHDGKPITHPNVDATNGWVKSDGDRNPADAELQISYQGKDADISKLGVTLTDSEGKVAKADAEETAEVSAWRGTKDFPVARNFGMMKFSKGTYDVGVDASGIDYWAVTKDSQLKNGGSLDVTGNTANQFVTLGFDSDNDGVADVDEPDNERYEPNPVDPVETVLGTPVTTASVTFDNAFTPDPEMIDPNATDSRLAGTKFELGDTTAADVNVPAGSVTVNPTTGEVTVDGNAPVGEYVIPVKVTYPDTTTEELRVNVKVTSKAHDYEPAYAATDVDPNDLASVSPTFIDKDGAPVDFSDPKNSPVGEPEFAFGALPTGVEEVPDPANVAPGKAHIDPVTGEITFSPTADQAGQAVELPVVVTYDDGTKDPVNAVFNVGALTNVTQPIYENGSGKPGSQVKIPAPTFDNPKTTDVETEAPPAGTKFELGPNKPDGATIDENTGAITVPVLADATPGDTIEVPVVVTYPDDSKDEVKVTVTVLDFDDNEKYQPVYEGKEGKPGDTVTIDKPTFTDKEGNPATPANVTYGSPEGQPAPAGATINPDGTITVVVPDNATNGQKIDVPVRVTYEDGTPDDVTATVTVRTDNDGDGYPDPLDPVNPQPGDDLCPDTPTGAKVDENGCSVAPTVEQPGPITGTVGEPITPVVVKVENLGLHTDLVCKAEGLPAGLDIDYDEAKGGCVITGTPTEEVTDRPVTITVEHKAPETDNPNTDPVVTNTTATINPAGDDDGDGVPNHLDKCPNTPAGAKVDPNTGCSVPPALGTIPVIDGLKDEAINPIVIPVTNEGKATITACTAENLPAELTIAYDESQSACVITGTPTVAGKTETVTVKVSYEPVDKHDEHNPAGVLEGTTSATINQKLVPIGPSTPSNSVTYEPAYTPVTGKPGQTVTVASPTFTDTDGKSATPTGVTYAKNPGGTGADSAAVANDGSITVPIPDTAKNGDTIVVPVRVTYEDGSHDDVTATVNVRTDSDNDGYPDPLDPNDPQPGDDKCPDTKPGETVNEEGCSLNDLNDPNYKPTTAEVGVETSSEAPTFDNPKTAEVETNPAPAGTTFALGAGAPENATIDPATGVVTMKPTVEQANKTFNIPVVVTYPNNGGVDETTAQFNVGDTQAATTTPKWDDSKSRPGVPVVIPNTGDDLPNGSVVAVEECPAGWTCKVQNGDELVVTPPADAPAGATGTVKVKVTYPDGSEDIETVNVEVVPNPNWNDTTTRPGKDVTIPNTGGVVPEGTKTEVTGPGTAELNPDGSITVKPNPDAKPGEQITVTIKDKDGRPIDEVTVTIVENPKWDDQNTRPGKDVTIPNTGGVVPEGTKTEVTGPGTATLNPDGSITVKPNPDAKPGDKITVTITDEVGDPIDEITVTIVPNPNWEDKETTPGKPIDIPNTGGDVPEGSTVEVTGSGDATLKDDGTITVTPNPDAKPGDVIKVTVKDKDGNVIDEFTVKIVEPDAPVVAKADPPAKKLSFTGASVLGTLGIAGLLTGVGALLVRRRNQ